MADSGSGKPGEKAKFDSLSRRASEARLTLIEAPAGYGKTEFAHYLMARDTALRQATPISIDFSKTAAVPAAVMRAWLEEMDVRAAANQADDSLEGLLLEEIGNAPLPLRVVIDGLETPPDQAFVDWLNHVIETYPNNVRLVILSRCQIPLNVARLQLSNRFCRLSAQDLKLNTDEVAKLAAGYAGPLSQAALYKLSEGWPAMLVLMMQAQKEAVSGAKSPLSDYLEPFVFAPLPERCRRFLVETSIFPVINSAAANAVRERDDSGQLLEESAALGVPVVTLDGDAGSLPQYRLHPLFRQFLRHQLELESPARQKALMVAAANWHETRNDYVAAVDILIEAGEEDQAAMVVERQDSLQRHVTEGLQGLRHCIGLLSSKTIQSYPRLQLIRVLLLFKAGLMSDAREQLKAAEDVTDGFSHDRPGGDPVRLKADADVISVFFNVYLTSICRADLVSDIEKKMDQCPPQFSMLRLLLQCFAFMAYQQRGEMGRAERALAKIDSLLVNNPGLWWDIWIPANIGLLCLAKGHLRVARQKFNLAIRACHAIVPEYAEFIAMQNVMLAEVGYEIGDSNAISGLEEALKHLDVAEGWFDHFAAGYGVLSKLTLFHSGAEEALAVLERAKEVEKERGTSFLSLFLPALRIEVLQMAGRAEMAAADIAETNFDEAWDNRHDLSWRERDILCRILTRAAISEQRFGDAEIWIERLIGDASRQGRALAHVQGVILKACLLAEQNNNDAALEQMREAINRAKAEEYLRVFVDEGKPVQSLITALLAQAYTLRLDEAEQKACKFIHAGFSRTSHVNPAEANFTKREIEVLRELGKGASNKEIARDLDLYVRTVKFHLSNIYRKLGVSTRKSAQAEARRRGLLA